MDALVKALVDNGALVSLVLLVGYVPAGLAIGKLWKALQACQAGRLEEAKESTPILENTNKVNTAVAAAIENRNRVTDGLDRTVAELVRRVDQMDRRS